MHSYWKITLKSASTLLLYRPEWQRYLAALQQVTRRYVEKYPYAANHVGQWGLSSATNFQHYPPGGGYKVFHTERRDRAEPV